MQTESVGNLNVAGFACANVVAQVVVHLVAGLSVELTGSGHILCGERERESVLFTILWIERNRSSSFEISSIEPGVSKGTFEILVRRVYDRGAVQVRLIAHPERQFAVDLIVQRERRLQVDLLVLQRIEYLVSGCDRVPGLQFQALHNRAGRLLGKDRLAEIAQLRFRELLGAAGLRIGRTVDGLLARRLAMVESWRAISDRVRLQI